MLGFDPCWSIKFKCAPHFYSNTPQRMPLGTVATGSEGVLQVKPFPLLENKQLKALT